MGAFALDIFVILKAYFVLALLILKILLLYLPIIALIARMQCRMCYKRVNIAHAVKSRICDNSQYNMYVPK